LPALQNGALSKKIDELEGWMLTQPQAPCNVRHRFALGLYIREVTILADTYAIGHHQKREHMNVMLTGSVTIIREDGSHEYLVAPQSFVAPPGRKVGYIHEDMVWLNIYATEETDIDTLEAMFLEKSPTYQAQDSPPLLTHDGDFEQMLCDLGVTAQQVREQSEETSDQIPFPNGDYKVKVGPSRIEGTGLLATSDIEAGEFICHARIYGKRTPAGRYINHSRTPNAEMMDLAGDILVRALRDIPGSRGGQDGEEITVDYRQARLVCQA
jgi:hypothetical protein